MSDEIILYIILSVATILSFIWIFKSRDRLNIKPPTAFLLAVLHTVIGVFCVKVFAFIENGSYGGMSLYGAIFFLPLVYYLGAKLTKRKMSDVFDVFGVCTIMTLACARVGCIITGCCLGKNIPGLDLRWPTRELEIIFYLILLALIYKKFVKEKREGFIYPFYMSCYGAFRFISEFFRVSGSATYGIFHISHFWSIICLLTGLSIYFAIQSESKRERERGKK